MDTKKKNYVFLRFWMVHAKVFLEGNGGGAGGVGCAPFLCSSHQPTVVKRNILQGTMCLDKGTHTTR